MRNGWYKCLPMSPFIGQPQLFLAFVIVAYLSVKTSIIILPEYLMQIIRTLRILLYPNVPYLAKYEI